DSPDVFHTHPLPLERSSSYSEWPRRETEAPTARVNMFRHQDTKYTHVRPLDVRLGFLGVLVLKLIDRRAGRSVGSHCKFHILSQSYGTLPHRLDERQIVAARQLIEDRRLRRERERTLRRQAELVQHADRGAVLRSNQCDYLFPRTPLECLPQARARSLGGEPPAPVRLGKQKRQLGTRRLAEGEEADAPDDRRAGLVDDRPHPVAGLELQRAREDALELVTRRGTCDQKAADSRLPVDGIERLGMRCRQRFEREAIGLDDGGGPSH